MNDRTLVRWKKSNDYNWSLGLGIAELLISSIYSLLTRRHDNSWVNTLFIISLSPLVIVYCPYHLLSGSGGQYQAHCSNKGRRPQCQGCLQRLPLRAATCNTKTKRKSKCNAENSWNSPHPPSPLLHPSRSIRHINNLDGRKNSPKLFTPPHLMFHNLSSIHEISWNQGNLLKSGSLSWSHITSENISIGQGLFIHQDVSAKQRVTDTLS